MKKMTTFTKWFLLNAVVLTALFLVEQKGFITLIVKNDLSHISIVIMTLYVLVSAYVGKLCYLADRATSGRDREDILKKADVGWFAAEHFFSLGLLGTILGLTIATQTSLKDTVTVSEVVGGLKVGLNTAFYTTICGIIFSLPLQIQLMILKRELDQ
jgi:hypothetical protein